MARTHRSQDRKRKTPSWKKASQRKGKPRTPFTVTSEVLGMPMFLSVADSETYPALQAYLEAHALLPADFDGSKPAWQSEIASALAVLDDATASPDEWLRAILVLGHTPTPHALAALRGHGSSDRTHAAIAMVAAGECQDWMRHRRESFALLN